jgi:hypothetical protein
MTPASDYEVDIPELKIKTLEKINSDPPFYEIRLEGVERIIRLTIDELLDFVTFRNRVAAVTNIVIQHPIPPEKGISKNDTWGMAIAGLFKNLVEVEAPEDADDNYLVRQKIKEFLNNSQYHTDDRLGIAELGKVWVNEKNGTYWVRGAEAIQTYLKAFMEKPPVASELWACFKDMGGISKTIWTGKAHIRCWGIQLDPPNNTPGPEDDTAGQTAQQPDFEAVTA